MPRDRTSPCPEKHDAELTDESVEAPVGKWQVGRIGRLQLDRLAWLELCARDLEHRRVEIGDGQRCACGRQVAQSPGYNAGAGARLKHTPRRERGDAFGHLFGEIGEEHRPQPVVVMLRNVSDETRRIIAHRLSP